MIADSLSVHFVLGSKLAAERHLKDFYREMILKNFCVLEEEEGAPLQAAIEESLPYFFLCICDPQVFLMRFLNNMTFNNMIELVLFGIRPSFEYKIYFEEEYFTVLGAYCMVL